jgi:hypothetical protein
MSQMMMPYIIGNKNFNYQKKMKTHFLIQMDA